MPSPDKPTQPHNLSQYEKFLSSVLADYVAATPKPYITLGRIFGATASNLSDIQLVCETYLRKRPTQYGGQDGKPRSRDRSEHHNQSHSVAFPNNMIDFSLEWISVEGTSNDYSSDAMD